MWQALIDNSGAVIAVFTAVLALTTIIYVVVSMKLLKKSRNALLADIFIRVMGIHRSELKEIEKEKGKEISISKGWTKGYREAFIEIDKKLGMDFSKIMLVGLETANKVWKEDTEKIEGKKGELEEKVKKLEKKLKEIEDLEHSKNHL